MLILEGNPTWKILIKSWNYQKNMKNPAGSLTIHDAKLEGIQTWQILIKSWNYQKIWKKPENLQKKSCRIAKDPWKILDGRYEGNWPWKILQDRQGSLGSLMEARKQIESENLRLKHIKNPAGSPKINVILYNILKNPEGSFNLANLKRILHKGSWNNSSDP